MKIVFASLLLAAFVAPAFADRNHHEQRGQRRPRGQHASEPRVGMFATPHRREGHVARVAVRDHRRPAGYWTPARPSDASPCAGHRAEDHVGGGVHVTYSHGGYFMPAPVYQPAPTYPAPSYQDTTVSYVGYPTYDGYAGSYATMPIYDVNAAVNACAAFPFSSSRTECLQIAVTYQVPAASIASCISSSSFDSDRRACLSIVAGAQ